MGMRIWQLLCAAVLVVVLAAAPARAQSCSDGNECTNPDMCSNGTCTGTPVAGSCDDGNPCTIDDTCVSGVCQGTPNPGATCGMAGCEGTCNAQGFCFPDQAKQGQPCTDQLGACTTDDKCIGTACFGTLVTCPDADNNPCTVDACNPANGECMTFGFSKCGECETCDAQGACIPANDGADCDDFNQCTGSGKCQDGSCLQGAPLGTPTETPLTPAATNTSTPTQTGTDTPGGPTITQTVTPTITNTSPPTDTPGGATPTDSPTVAPTDSAAVARATATDTPVLISTDTATIAATQTETFTPDGTATATVTATATGIPTGTTTATVTATRTNTPTVVIPATSTATATHTPLPVMASIIVGDTTGLPGTTALFSVTLESEASIAGVQVDIAYDAKAPIAAKEDGKPDCTVNAEIDKSATSFAFQPSGCAPDGEPCTAVRAIVLSLQNLDPIPNGSRLFDCNVAIAADATGTYPLTCSNPGAGDTNGDKVGADCSSGTVTVAVPTDATIVVGDVVGAAGQDATLTVSLQTDVSVAGTQNDTIFPAGVSVVANNNGRPTCSVNPAIDKGGTSFAFVPNGCTPGTDCDGVRALVLALDNVSPIPDGSVLYTCEVSIGSAVEDGSYPLTCVNQGASDPDGHAVATSCSAGNVIVGVQPTPTSTPSVSPSVTPTNTPTATPTPEGRPTDTVTPTPSASATATRTRKPKSNDDDGCQVVAPAEGGEAWLLLLPVAALLWRRRR